MEKQVIQSVGFRNLYEDGRAVGFQLKIRLPYYRGVFLSQIKPGSLTVDGEVFSPDQVLWKVGGETYTAAEMRADWKTHWHPLEPAVLVVKKGGAGPGVSRHPVRLLLHPLLHAAFPGVCRRPRQARDGLHAGDGAQPPPAAAPHRLIEKREKRG